MNGHCKDCKFWGGRYHYLGYDMDTETSHGPVENWDGKKSCRLMTTDFSDVTHDIVQSGGYGPEGGFDKAPKRPIEKRSLALAYGDRGGNVITEGDFGCVQFEAKE